MSQYNDNYERIIYSARWAIIGRLTASLFHEINNPMQIIQGATCLAMESLPTSNSPNSHKNINTYLNLTLQESERIMRLIARAQRVYRPENDWAEEFDLNNLLQEVVTLTSENMHRKKIIIQTEFEPSLPIIHTQFSELSLAFLCPLLEISDAVEAIGGGIILLSSYMEQDQIYVKFSTQSLLEPPQGGFLFIVCREVIAKYHGSINNIFENNRLSIIINLPFSSILQTTTK